MAGMKHKAKMLAYEIASKKKVCDYHRSSSLQQIYEKMDDFRLLPNKNPFWIIRYSKSSLEHRYKCLHLILKMD